MRRAWRDKEDNMTMMTISLVVIGAATCTGWVFKLVDIIERPNRNEYRKMIY